LEKRLKNSASTGSRLFRNHLVDSLAPLTIEPKPDSVLRVSLYFKALEEKIDVTPPALSPFERKGFTVTEWGGLFKADKEHPNFTCVM
jgi:hypothetical protein